MGRTKDKCFVALLSKMYDGDASHFEALKNAEYATAEKTTERYKHDDKESKKRVVLTTEESPFATSNMGRKKNKIYVDTLGKIYDSNKPYFETVKKAERLAAEKAIERYKHDEESSKGSASPLNSSATEVALANIKGIKEQIRFFLTKPKVMTNLTTVMNALKEDRLRSLPPTPKPLPKPRGGPNTRRWKAPESTEIITKAVAIRKESAPRKKTSASSTGEAPTLKNFRNLRGINKDIVIEDTDKSAPVVNSPVNELTVDKKLFKDKEVSVNETPAGKEIVDKEISENKKHANKVAVNQNTVIYSNPLRTLRVRKPPVSEPIINNATANKKKRIARKARGKVASKAVTLSFEEFPGLKKRKRDDDSLDADADTHQGVADTIVVGSNFRSKALSDTLHRDHLGQHSNNNEDVLAKRSPGSISSIPGNHPYDKGIKDQATATGVGEVYSSSQVMFLSMHEDAITGHCQDGPGSLAYDKLNSNGMGGPRQSTYNKPLNDMAEHGNAYSNIRGESHPINNNRMGRSIPGSYYSPYDPANNNNKIRTGGFNQGQNNNSYAQENNQAAVQGHTPAVGSNVRKDDEDSDKAVSIHEDEDADPDYPSKKRKTTAYKKPVNRSKNIYVSPYNSNLAQRIDSMPTKLDILTTGVGAFQSLAVSTETAPTTSFVPIAPKNKKTRPQSRKPHSHAPSTCVNCGLISSYAWRNVKGPSADMCEHCNKRRTKKS